MLPIEKNAFIYSQSIKCLQCAYDCLKKTEPSIIFGAFSCCCIYTDDNNKKEGEFIIASRSERNLHGQSQEIEERKVEKAKERLKRGREKERKSSEIAGSPPGANVVSEHSHGLLTSQVHTDIIAALYFSLCLKFVRTVRAFVYSFFLSFFLYIYSCSSFLYSLIIFFYFLYFSFITVVALALIRRF